MTVDTKNPLKVEAGRKGGLTTLKHYGRERLAEWGRRGGRPRSLNYEDIRQRQFLVQSKNKEVMSPPGELNIGQLKKRYRLRDRSSPIPEIVPAGSANETPREPSLPERKAVSR